MNTTVSVFYYTGPYTDTLLPNADGLIGRLSPQRRERLLKHAERQRMIELVSLRLLELGMAARGYTEFALADVEYAQVAGVTKKPFWTKGDTAFSISHTNGMAIVAIAATGAVGVDVEHRRPVDPKIVRRLLNDQAAAAADLNAENALSRWTQIEAVLKGAGIGVMHGREIEWNHDALILRGKRWKVLPIECGPGHIAHFAVDADAVKASVIQIELV